MKSSHRLPILSILLALALLLMSAVGINALTRSTQQMTQQFGQQQAENYRLQNMAVIATYRTVLETAARNIRVMYQDGKDISEIHQWICQFSQDAMDSSNNSYTGLYAVLDGQYMNSVGWTPPPDYDAAQRQWYLQAVALDGTVYYSDLYTDVLTEEEIVTLSVSVGDGNVVAIDINARNMEQEMNQQLLPEGNIHVTFDRSGQCICHKCWDLANCPHDSAYFQNLYQQLLDHFQEESFLYRDALGSEQIVYSMPGSSGWLSVSSVSYDPLTQINRRLIYGLLAAGVLYFLALGGVLLRNWHHSRLSEENAKILHALGDTYYAIYLIHTGTAQCRMVKPSADVAQAMGSNTSYQRLVDVMAGLMEPDTSGQFRREFDLDNIRSLAARGIRDFGGDFRRKFPNGQYEWVNIQLLLTGTGLDSDEVIFAFRQISHEKLRETQRVRLLEESIMAAQAGNAAKSSFLSNMSHDMRTPLNAIIGFSQLAEKNVHDPGRVTEYLKKIRFSSDHLLQLINDILDMAKIEQGHLTLREEPFSLNSLCRQTAEAFQTQAEAEGKSFFFHCDPGENHVLGDSLRISQVLNNLLSNAVKFTPAGGKIRFELRQTALLNQNAALFQLVVSDTGVGMSPEFLDKLFLPFERETRFHSSQMSGTGLGMPIVKSILQTMNGSIDVATQPGHGTTFTVTLPLKLQQSSSENIAPQETKGADLDLSGANLLVAEDNLLNMEIAVELLTMNGAVVTQATNGQEVLDLFSQSPPGTFQAILMDMQMPVMDGLEATRRIRKLDRPDAGIIPIIAVTANAFPDDVAAILEAGMNAYISKPMDFQKLMETLGQYLS